MRKEHRPVYVTRGKRWLDKQYADHFLVPHFDAVGEGCGFENPYYIQVVGSPIELGKHVQIVGMSDNRVRLTAWGVGQGLGRIRIGDYTVINPGARITSGCSIEIGRNALFAANVSITDADSHGLYDRVHDPGGYAPIVIGDNVWLADGVCVLKGVTIGKNTVVGARSLVVNDLPDHCVAAGNPARVIRELDPNATYYSRSDVMADQSYLDRLYELERYLTRENTLMGFLRYLLFPKRGD